LLFILSSILRILFWFGKRYHYSLLIQSILMVMMQVYVLKVAIDNASEDEDDEASKIDLDYNINKFTVKKNPSFFSFEWNRLSLYVLFSLIFATFFSILSLLITFENQVYTECLGSAAVLLEASLTLPQIIEICRVKSTENLSWILIASWIIGDSLKLGYFYISEAPLQLLIMACVQVTQELVIVGQVFMYRHNSLKVTSMEQKDLI